MHITHKMVGARLMSQLIFIFCIAVLLNIGSVFSQQIQSNQLQTNTEDKFQYAIKFNGVSDYVSPNNDISGINNFTFIAWVLPEATHEIDVQADTGTSGIKGQRYLLYPPHGTHGWGENHAGFGISVGRNGVSVYEHASDYMPALLVYEANLTDWVHVCVVYSNRTPSLYINGEFVKRGLQSKKEFVHISGLEKKKSNRYGGIGGGTLGHFKGLVAEVELSPKALSGFEIKASFLNPKTLNQDEILFRQNDKETNHDEPGITNNNQKKESILSDATTKQMLSLANQPVFIKTKITVCRKNIEKIEGRDTTLAKTKIETTTLKDGSKETLIQDTTGLNSLYLKRKLKNELN